MDRMGPAGRVTKSTSQGVCGLVELTVGTIQSVCFLQFLGEKKISELHSATAHWAFGIASLLRC